MKNHRLQHKLLKALYNVYDLEKVKEIRHAKQVCLNIKEVCAILRVNETKLSEIAYELLEQKEILLCDCTEGDGYMITEKGLIAKSKKKYKRIHHTENRQRITFWAFLFFGMCTIALTVLSVIQNREIKRLEGEKSKKYQELELFDPSLQEPTDSIDSANFE